MCGSKPDADAVTRSTGTGTVGFSFFAASTFAVTASISFLFVGHNWLPPELAASYGVAVADGRDRKYPGDENP